MKRPPTCWASLQGSASLWEMGGSNELEGARMAGMMAIQAKGYTNRHPQKRDSKAGFLTAEVPLDILRFFG